MAKPTPKSDEAREAEPLDQDAAVDEASRESMDASDPPARSVVTRVGEPKRPSDPKPKSGGGSPPGT